MKRDPPRSYNAGRAPFPTKVEAIPASATLELSDGTTSRGPRPWRPIALPVHDRLDERHGVLGGEPALRDELAHPAPDRPARSASDRDDSSRLGADAQHAGQPRGD